MVVVLMKGAKRVYLFFVKLWMACMPHTVATRIKAFLSHEIETKKGKLEKTARARMSREDSTSTTIGRSLCEQSRRNVTEDQCIKIEAWVDASPKVGALRISTNGQISISEMKFTKEE